MRGGKDRERDREKKRDCAKERNMREKKMLWKLWYSVRDQSTTHQVFCIIVTQLNYVYI